MIYNIFLNIKLKNKSNKPPENIFFIAGKCFTAMSPAPAISSKVVRWQCKIARYMDILTMMMKRMMNWRKRR